jgi:hypothetical protein
MQSRKQPLATSNTNNTIHKLSLNPLDNIIEQEADDGSPMIRRQPYLNLIVVNDNSG